MALGHAGGRMGAVAPPGSPTRLGGEPVRIEAGGRAPSANGRS